MTKQELHKAFILEDDGIEYDRFWMIEDFHDTPDGCVYRTFDSSGNMLEVPCEEDDRVIGSRFIGTDYSAVNCTGFALRICQKLGAKRVKIYGFFCENNPEAAILAEMVDGHDFAVVDDRYIVDPWLVDIERGNITAYTGKTAFLGGGGVFDLEDPADSELIHQIYGERNCWERIFQLEAEAFNE